MRKFNIKQAFIGVIEWIPILGLIFILIVSIINIIDYYKGKTYLKKGYDPYYLKSIIYRTKYYPLIIINSIWHGIITVKILQIIL